jgi:hypothetical protein
LISVRCFDSLETASHLRHEINALNRLSGRPDPFSTFEFLQNFHAHDDASPDGRSLSLWFLTAFQADRLVGYVALKTVRHRILGLKTHTLRFLVAHDGDRPHVVTRPEHLLAVSEAFCAYALARGKEWSLLEFHQQDNTSSLFPPSFAFDPKHYRVRQWPNLENCTIRMRWDTLRDYAAALPKKFRTNLRRQMRSLFAHGKLELLGSSDPEATPALFELYRGIESHSWKSAAKVNLGRHPARVEYIRGLLGTHQPMRVSVQVLLLDRRPIAGLISGMFMNGMYAIDIVYDRRLSSMAPGSAMLLMGMRKAIDSRCAFVNLLSGFAYYKVLWLADVVETRVVQIYRAGRLPFWRRQVGDAVRRAFPAKHGAEPVRFNLLRRRAGGRDGDPALPAETRGLQVWPDERVRIDGLIAQSGKGNVEFLSVHALSALMPFDLRGSADGGQAPDP